MAIECEVLGRDRFPDFSTGDTIDVYIKYRDNDKERIQKYSGIVMQRRHPNTNGETFTIKIGTGKSFDSNVSAEMVIPIMCPDISKIEVKRRGMVRRARLNGSSFRIKHRLSQNA